MFCSYLNRFSAPDLSMSSLLICMLSFDLLVCSLPRQVAARGSEPCNQKIVKIENTQYMNYIRHSAWLTAVTWHQYLSLKSDQTAIKWNDFFFDRKIPFRKKGTRLMMIHGLLCSHVSLGIPIFLHMEYGIDWLSINGSGWLHIIHKYSFLPSEYWILSHSGAGVGTGFDRRTEFYH